MFFEKCLLHSMNRKPLKKQNVFLCSVVNCAIEFPGRHRQKYKTKAKKPMLYFCFPKNKQKITSLKNLLEKKVQPTNSANIGWEANFFSAPAGYERPVFV